MRHLALVGVPLAALALAACGSGEDPVEKPRLEMSAAEMASRPPIAIQPPHGPAPRELVVRDPRRGSGAAMKEGDAILIAWVEVPYDEASEKTASSPERELKFSFGKYIEGWEEGLLGMRVGGRRELIVPLRLGDTGQTMIYAIDLLGVEPS